MIATTRRRPRTAALIVFVVLFAGWTTSLLASGHAPWRDLAWSAVVTAGLGGCLALVALVLLAKGLTRGGPVFAVAGVLVAETIRRRVALLCTGLLLAGLALLPFMLRANPVVEYRLQSFLGYALFLTFFLLSILTIFGACGSLCEEIVDRRIQTVAVKPIGRTRFLIGKWLGLCLLDLILLAVAGGVISGSLGLELARARAAGENTAAAEELIIVRRGISPERPPELIASLRVRADEWRRSQPDRWIQLVEESDGNEDHALVDLQAKLYADGIRAWRSVPPGEGREYRFAVPSSGTGATLRLRPELGRVHSTERIRFKIGIDGTTQPYFIGIDGSDPIPIPVEATADGWVVVTVENLPEPDRTPRTAIFRGKDSVLVELQVGGFAGNLARGLAILAIQLGFIAALGLAAATFLGLPVAVLLVVVVIGAAAGGGMFLGTESPLDAPAHLHGHDHGSGDPKEQASAVLRFADRLGRAFVGIFAIWGKSSAIGPVSSGQEVPLSHVGACLLWIGGLWTGLVAFGGGLVFARRELARVQV